MINRVVLVGRLTRDVEVRKTQSGLSVASFTVACDRNVRRSNDNNQQTADFISCVAWRQSADFLGQYAHKGAMIGVDGRLQTRNYDRADGTKVYVTEVVADNVQLLESRAQSEARGQQNSYNNNNSYGNGYDNSFNQQSSYPANNGYSGNSQNNQPSGNNDDYNSNDASLDISSDDLPF